MNIDLSNPLNLPKEYVDQFRAIQSLCACQNSPELLFEKSDVFHLVSDIDQYCRKNRIIGVHYTRAVPESIYAKGLLIRDGKEIRKAFLIEHGHLLSQEEILTLNKKWDDYYVPNQSRFRDGRIYFNFTEDALVNGGAKDLLELYGGEQVSMCFRQNDPIGLKLGTIGKPMVVRCSLDPNQVTTFTAENPWGKILFSSFHTSINPDAYQYDLDGYQTIPVKPEDIVELRVRTK